jgi:hypothetical protein
MTTVTGTRRGLRTLLLLCAVQFLAAPEALVAGFQRALFAAAVFVLVAAAVAVRATNTREGAQA